MKLNVLELGDLFAGADLPDIDTASQVTESRAEQESALGLVEQEIAVLRAKRVDGFGLEVKHLDLRRHVCEASVIGTSPDQSIPAATDFTHSRSTR